MERVWTSVVASADLKERIKPLEDVLEMMVDRTIECAIFIRQYTAHGFSGMTSFFWNTSFIVVYPHTLLLRSEDYWSFCD